MLHTSYLFVPAQENAGNDSMFLPLFCTEETGKMKSTESTTPKTGMCSSVVNDKSVFECIACTKCTVIFLQQRLTHRIAAHREVIGFVLVPIIIQIQLAHNKAYGILLIILLQLRIVLDILVCAGIHKQILHSGTVLFHIRKLLHTAARQLR